MTWAKILIGPAGAGVGAGADELHLAAGDRRFIADGEDPRKLQRKLLVVAYIITHRRTQHNN